MQITQTVEEEMRNLSKHISSSTEHRESALKEVMLTVKDTKKEYKRKEMRNRQ